MFGIDIGQLSKPAVMDRRNGDAFVLEKVLAGCVLGYNTINDRILLTKIQGKPVNITVIQVYAPTSDAEDAEIDEFHATLQEVLDQYLKTDVIWVILMLRLAGNKIQKSQENLA